MNGWSKVTLSSVSVVFTDGDWIESKDQSRTGIRLIQTGNVGIGDFKDRVDKARYISADTFQRLRCEEIYEGDCLVSRLPDPVGRACIIPAVKERLITAVDCTIIRFDTSKIIPEYFRYFSQSTAYLADVESSCTGATRKRISRKKLGEIKIPLPSLCEQSRIVAAIDRAFEAINVAIANTENSLISSRKLLHSYLEYAFRQGKWDKKAVGEVADHVLGKMLDGKKNKGQSRPYLRNLNVRWFDFDLTDVQNMPFEDSEHERYTAKKGDVLVCEGGYPGRAAIWSGEKPVFFQKAIHRVRFKEGVYNKWFLYFLYMMDANGKLRENFTGAGIQHFTGEALHKLCIPFPPKNDAQAYVTKFDDLLELVKNLEAVYLRKLACLAELQQVILHDAFSGKLNVKRADAVHEVAE